MFGKNEMDGKKMAIQLIGIVGLPGAGKSTALEAVQNYGPIFIMGNVVREELVKRGIEYTSENLGNLSKQLRQEFGENVIAMKIIEKVKDYEKSHQQDEIIHKEQEKTYKEQEQTHKEQEKTHKEQEQTHKEDEKTPVFIDGLRSDKEYYYFKQHYPISIIFLDCPEEIRYQRLSVRGRADDSTDFREAKKRDEREIGFGLLKLKELATYILDSSRPAETMKEKCIKAIQKILQKSEQK